MTVLNSTKIKRCTTETIPEHLPLGHPVFCTDTGVFYVGMGEGNALLPVRDYLTLELVREEINSFKNKDLNELKTAISDLDSKYAVKLEMVDRRITNIEQSGGVSISRETVTPYRYVESLVGNGQNAYTLNRMYEVGLERLEVFVGGIFQKSGRDYTETNASTITFNENIPTGVVIDVVIYTKSVAVLNHTHADYLGRGEKASDSSRLNGLDSTVNPTPNTIPIRNESGHLYSSALRVFNENNLEEYMGAYLCARNTGLPLYWNNLTKRNALIHCEESLPVEEGSWQPTIYGSTHGVMTTTIQSGMYTRVGKVVTINGRVRVDSGRQGATGDLRIGGLPYIPRGVVATGSIGHFRGIEVGSGCQLGIFADVQSSFLRVVISDTKSDDTNWLSVNCGSHMNGNIIDLSFNMTYKIE